MKKKSILILSLFIILFVCGCGKQQETKNDEIKLGEYEQMIFDYIIENDFYNQKEVRVAAANKLYGFKLSAFNKVGGNISKCYDFFKPTEYNTIIKETLGRYRLLKKHTSINVCFFICLIVI